MRATLPGILVGGAVAFGAGAYIGMALCTTGSDVGRRTKAECGAPALLGGVLVGAVGMLAGGVLGAGIPLAKRAGSDARFWQRASGEIGTLSVGLGMIGIVGGGEQREASLGLTLGYYTRIGRFFSVGPEAGYARFSTKDFGNLVVDRMTWRLGGAFRFHGPQWRRARPFLLAGVGIVGGRWDSGDLDASLGGNTGLGLEWMGLPVKSLAATLDIRIHGRLGEPHSGTVPTYLSTMAGLSWIW